MSHAERIMNSMDGVTVTRLRRLAARNFKVIEDPRHPHEVRVIACSTIGWVLYYLEDDKRLIAQMLATIRRAITRDDTSPLLLLWEAGTTIERNVKLATAVMKLGEYALKRKRTYALARVTIALGRRTDALLQRGRSPDPLRAPSRWIRALVESGPVEGLSGDVRDAVRWWLRDGGNDLAAVADLILDPERWGDLEGAIPNDVVLADAVIQSASS
jgi:hypothetical protein